MTTGLESGGIALAIIGSISASIMAFIKMLSDRNAVIEIGKCCKLDLRSKEVRLEELRLTHKQNNDNNI